MEKKRKRIGKILERYWIYIFALLACTTGIVLRVINIKNDPGVIFALDPYYFMRLAKELKQNGFLPLYDYFRYFPDKVKLTSSWPLAFFIYILSIPLGSVENAATAYPVLCFTIMLIFYYLLAKEVGGKKVACLAVALMAMIPIGNYFFRTSARFADKEPLASMLFVIALYLLVRGIKRNSLLTAFAGGVFQGIGTCIWGGNKVFSLALLMFSTILAAKSDRKYREILEKISAFAALTAVSHLLITVTIREIDLYIYLITAFMYPISVLLDIICSRLEKVLEDKYTFFAQKEVILSTAIILALFVAYFTKYWSSVVFLLASNRSRMFISVSENQPTLFIAAYQELEAMLLFLFALGIISLAIQYRKDMKKLVCLGLIVFFILSSVVVSPHVIEMGIRSGTIVSGTMYTLPIAAALCIYITYTRSKKVYPAALLGILLVVYMLFNNFNLAWNPYRVLIIPLFAAFMVSAVLYVDPQDFSYYFVLLLLSTMFVIKDWIRGLYFVPFSVSFLIPYSADILRRKIKVISSMLEILPIAIFVAAILPVPIAFSLYYTAVNLSPTVSNVWIKGFYKIKNSTPEYAVMVHWWDYGYWMQYYAERITVVDGGNMFVWRNEYVGGKIFAAQNKSTLLEGLRKLGYPDYFFMCSREPLIIIHPFGIGKVGEITNGIFLASQPIRVSNNTTVIISSASIVAGIIDRNVELYNATVIIISGNTTKEVTLPTAVLIPQGSYVTGAEIDIKEKGIEGYFLIPIRYGAGLGLLKLKVSHVCFSWMCYNTSAQYEGAIVLKNGVIYALPERMWNTIYERLYITERGAEGFHKVLELGELNASTLLNERKPHIVLYKIDYKELFRDYFYGRQKH